MRNNLLALKDLDIFSLIYTVLHFFNRTSKRCYQEQYSCVPGLLFRLKRVAWKRSCCVTPIGCLKMKFFIMAATIVMMRNISGENDKLQTPCKLEIRGSLHNQRCNWKCADGKKVVSIHKKTICDVINGLRYISHCANVQFSNVIYHKLLWNQRTHFDIYGIEKNLPPKIPRVVTVRKIA